ncbi:MFS transporter [uncultured Arthrobacter sp.]|uniref:MFS transporter n=1 Tax=uncultured Arthrobacter sp. TaxID=114050 RepID=UPI003217A179
MSKENIESIYPLSPMQEGMLFHSLTDKDSTAYFEQYQCTYEGDFDVGAYQQAWARVTERHPILRTLVMWKRKDKSLQVVRKQVELEWDVQDWRALPPDQIQQQLAAFLLADRVRGFDLTKAPLMRFALFRLADKAYRFVWSFHHLLLDGWSGALLSNEVFAFYQAARDQGALQLKRARPYQDYIAWLQKQDLTRAQAFWKKRLEGFSSPTPLYAARGAAPDGAGEGNRTAPLLDLSLFGNRVFSTAIIANVLALFSFNGFILFLAQHLQLLEGQSPSESGVAMVPALIATVAAGLLVVPLVKKVRPGFVVAGGLLLSAAGYFLVAFGDHGNGPALLLAALLVLCLGVGAAETISNDLILGAAPAEKSGAAAAISETGYEIGSLLGTAILGSILTASYQGNLRLPAGVAEAVPAEASDQAGETLAGAVELAQALPGPLADAVMTAARAAFDSGVHITAAIALVLMAGASVLAAVVLRKVPTAR